MRPDLPTGRVALLLTDIEGSTRLLKRLGAQGYARAQADHRDLLRQTFRESDGVEVDTQGDAFFYVFPNAPQCLVGAVAATRALARHSWSHGQAVKVRMGMHCGEPQPTEEGYVGMVVNMAARITSIAHGGQILLSADAADELREVLDAADVTLKDLGDHRLRDLEVPQRLFQVVIPELPSDFPPPRSVAARPNNLPVSLTPFIGRGRMIQDLHDLVLNPRTRLITLLGPGGIGKSRLGLELARELLNSFEDGAWFVGLAAIRESGLVLPEIAAKLGVKEEAGTELKRTLSEYLNSRNLLLLLDNFEQVPDAARDVGELLATCAGLKAIVTSRQPLKLKGERRIPVPPMALPASGSPLDEIAQSEAVRLFADSAEQVCWDFELDETNARDVVEICRRVDALPLAIELATAKLATMSVSELLKALDNRLGVLTQGSVDLLDHQQTLRDLVAWSYDLLDEEEQRLWRRLAVFSGGAPMDAVQSVCDPDGENHLPQGIDSLVMKSLVNLEFDRHRGGIKRIVILETLREFAAERMEETSEATDLYEAHAKWYRGLAEEAQAGLRGADTENWLARLDLDLNNFRAAMERGFTGRTDPEDAAVIIGALWFYFYERGLLEEGSSWLESALAADVPPAIAARAALGLANLERVRGRPGPARTHCEAALEVFRSEKDEEGMARSLSQLGAILQHLGEFELAGECLTEAAKLQKSLHSFSDLCFTLVALGASKHILGDLDGAERDYAESLSLGRQLADKNHIATALVNLGELKQQDGHHAEATLLLAEALDLYHGLGVRNAIAFCLELLAGIAVAEGKYQRSVLLFGAADKLRELIDSPMESFNRERYERDLARAKAVTGDAVFAEAWRQGADMSLGEVVRFAISAGEPVERP